MKKDIATRLAEIRAKGPVYRTADVVAVDVEARTVELSFSSEAEYRRWWGIEVLDHAPGAVDLDRINDGGALLWNHNWDDQRGVVVKGTARIDGDRMGRCTVKLSRSEAGEELLQDIADGIKTKVSVGYEIIGMRHQETRDEIDVYLVTEWQPIEISIVSVPADTTVGVGRSLEIPQEETNRQPPENVGTRNQADPKQSPKETDMNVKNLRDAKGNLVRAKVDDEGNILEVLEVLEKAGDDAQAHVQRGADAERNRVRGINDLAKQYGEREMALEFIGEGKSPEDFQRALLDKLNKRDGKDAKPAAEQPSPYVGLSDKEARNFSLFRAVRALLPNASAADREAAAFEFECSRAAEAQYGKQAQGILIPQDVLDRAFNAGGAADTPTGAQTGSNLVATDFKAGSFVEMLRNRTTIMRLAQVMGGLVGNVEVPKQTGGATAYWIGEGEDATEGTPTIGQIGLTPHTIAAYTDITRRLMMQSTPDAEGIVRRDLLAALGLGIDLAGYYGPGTGNQPRGIANYTGINGVAFAGAQPTYQEYVQMETEIAADNADVNSMAYVINAVGRGAAKTTPKFADGASVAGAGVIWEGGGTINGYRTEVTNQVQTGDVFFGNFADMIVGLWGGLDLTVDPYSLSKSGGTRIVVFQDVDFVLRRLESFAYGKKA